MHVADVVVVTDVPLFWQSQVLSDMYMALYFSQQPHCSRDVSRTKAEVVQEVYK